MDTGSNRSVCLHQTQNLLSLLRHGIQTSHPGPVVNARPLMTHVTSVTSDLPYRLLIMSVSGKSIDS